MRALHLLYATALFSWPVTSAFGPSDPTHASAPWLLPANTPSRNSRFSALPAASSRDDDEDGDAYTIQVTYEGRTTSVSVHPDEPILAALERTAAADRLALPGFPHDCRRGNCLTCTGRHAPGSVSTNLERGEDGLAPHVSSVIDAAGFVLTCSSYVVGEGVKIDLGQNAQAWDDLYCNQLNGEEAERVGREARAKVLRLAAERDVARWKSQTEEALKHSGG